MQQCALSPAAVSVCDGGDGCCFSVSSVRRSLLQFIGRFLASTEAAEAASAKKTDKKARLGSGH